MKIILRAKDDYYGFYADGELVHHEQFSAEDLFATMGALHFEGVMPQNVCEEDDEDLFLDDYPQDITDLVGTYDTTPGKQGSLADIIEVYRNAGILFMQNTPITEVDFEEEELISPIAKMLGK